MTPSPELDLDALIRAQGLALATLEALLIHKGVLRQGELSGQLAVMAEVTSEADPLSGEVVRDWAAVLAQVDRAQTRKSLDGG